MNVGELKKLLEHVPDDYTVWTDESLLVNHFEIDEEEKQVELGNL